MSTVFRANRKVEDADIIRLNSLGYSLSHIAEIYDCHISTITLRLKALGVPPADTRRTFMEDIYKVFTPSQLDILADKLGPHLSIKDHVRNLILKDLLIP